MNQKDKKDKDTKVQEGLKQLLNRSELRRLEKAARDKDKNKLKDWARQFEEQMANVYDKAYDETYEEIYQNELMKSMDNLYLTIIYTLHFNNTTQFGIKRINGFMEDLLETIDMFRRGEAIPSDYQKQLEKDGIKWKTQKENEDEI